MAALVTSSLILAACGNADDTEEEATDDTEESTATTEEDTEESSDTTEAEGEGEEAAEDEIDLGEFQPIEGVPGVTDEEIGFAVLGTGPANPLGYCLLECYLGGVQAYFDWRNSVGGVHGRDLTIARTEDDELANTQVKLLELVEDESVFGILAAPLTYAGFPDVAAAGVPLYTTFPASPEVDGDQSTYVPNGVLCSDCPNPMTVWTATMSEKTKVGSLGFGVSQSSKDCVARTVRDVELFGPDAGIEHVYANSELQFGLPNGLGPEVTAMKDAGVDFITLCVDQNSALILEQELERQGMTDVVVVLPQGYGDTEFISANADLLEGDLMGTAFRPLEAEAGASTMQPIMTEWLEKNGVLPNDYAVQGWLGADLAVTGLLAAGPEFDREAVVEATNQITDYTAGGILPPVDWTSGHDMPSADGAYRFCQTFVRVTGGATEVTGDPEKPFYCYEGPIEEWAEPETFG